MGIIRVLLALFVVLYHTGSFFNYTGIGGETAVQLFFIVSGFYMALILNEKYTGPGSYKLFLSNRLLKLFPTYFVVLGLAVTFLALTYTPGRQDPLDQFITFQPQMNVFSFLLLVVTNLVIFGQDLLLFLKVNLPGGGLDFTADFRMTHPELFSFMFVPQAWSLGSELLFYSMAPFLVRRKNLKLLLGVGAFTLGLRYVLANLGLPDDPWRNRFFPTELTFFLAGTLAYFLYARLRNSRFDRPWVNRTIGLFLIALLLTYQLVWKLLDHTMVLLPVLYVVFALLIPFAFLWTKSNKFDKYVGELSYPLYLSHILVRDVCNALVPHASYDPNLYPVVVGAASLGAALLLSHFVITPVDRFRQGRVRVRA